MSYLTLNTGSAPAVPATGKVSLFADATRSLNLLDEKGVLNTLSNNNYLNYLRNSGFWFCQRQGPTATNCGSTTLRHGGGLTGCDGWGVWDGNANTTYTRVDTSTSTEVGIQARFYGQFLKVTGTEKIFVS